MKSSNSTKLLKTRRAVNDDPYGEGWMVKIKMSDTSQLDDLMDSDAYQNVGLIMRNPGYRAPAIGWTFYSLRLFVAGSNLHSPYDIQINDKLIHL